jgi:hypothetical protein
MNLHEIAKPSPVSLDPARGSANLPEFLEHAAGERDSAVMRALANEDQRALHRPEHIEVARLELHPSGLDLREIQDDR